MGKLKDKIKNRFDGWQNLLTGAGMLGRDKRAYTSYGAGPILGQVQLRQMYEGEGFARRIINLPAREMTRQWIEIEGDTDGLCLEELKRLKAKTSLRDMIRWARLYGGALAVLGLDDRQDLEAPLNEAGLQGVEFIRVHDRHRISWTSDDLYADSNHPKFGEPEFYTINPINGAMYRVHESRTLIMDGEPVPEETRSQNNGWGGAALQAVHSQLRDLGEAYSGTASIIQDFITGTLNISNLHNLLASGQEDLVIRRLGLMDQSRHIINTVLLDKEEVYQKHASSVSGLADLLDRFALALSAVTGIPQTLLMGQSPAGLSATGDADIRFWYDNIKSDQEDKLLPPLERLVTLIMAAKRGPFKGREPEGWAIRFNPLWQLSDKEEAEFRKTVAETDNIYLTTGVVDPAEVAHSRFGGGEVLHGDRHRPGIEAGAQGAGARQGPGQTSGRAMATPEPVLEAIRQRKANYRPGKFRKKLKKPKRWLWPASVAREYTRALWGLVEEMNQAIEEDLLSFLPELVELAASTRPDYIRSDDVIDWAEKVAQLTIKARTGFDKKRKADPERLARIYAEQAASWNDKEFKAVVKSALGIDPFAREPWLRAELNGFVKQNVALIKSLPDTHFKDIEGITLRGLQAGRRHEELAKGDPGEVPGPQEPGRPDRPGPDLQAGRAAHQAASVRAGDHPLHLADLQRRTSQVQASGQGGPDIFLGRSSGRRPSPGRNPV